MTPSERDKQPPLARESWEERCARLFEEMRRPARAMVARAYGRAFGDAEIEDVYSAAWAATLAALRDRGRRMDEAELRAYILTAVASHASKELRRRARKPLHPLEVEREQSTADGHEPLPDEVAIGSEARSVARDLLTSLPQRRRAVMLLRYGWGLSPGEVCALVPGLSPRAYRKEITRGVEEMIEGLGRVESGEWCAERQSLVRDLVAGTADDAERRQAVEHLRHCRSCAELAARLKQDLHEAGSALGLASVAGSIGGATLLQRLADVVAGAKSALGGAVERADSAVTGLTASGVKGSGAGVLANVAGVGGAAKATVACIGAGAAATACVAAGVVPGVSFEGDPSDTGSSRSGRPAVQREHAEEPRSAIVSVRRVSRAVEPDAQPAVAPPEQPAPAPAEPPPSAPPPAPEPATPAPVEEFDPVAAPVPAPAATGAPPAPSGGAPAAGSVAQEEFGP
jgi:RNA polymerase sigma factor (sigma-70 family)